MNLPKYSEYKKTNVDWLTEVPAHWNIESCRGILTDRNERNEPLINENYLSLMANIGIILYEEKGDVGNKKPEDLGKCKQVYPGDLVINSMNYGIGSYGLSKHRGVCSPVYIVLTPKLNKVEERYAFRILEIKKFQQYAQSFGNGILEHRASISWDILKNIGLPLPPIEEQRKILQFLDIEIAKIDNLVKDQERLIELLKEKRQAVISTAVTKGLDLKIKMKDSEISWLGEIPDHWSLERIRRFVKLNPSKSELGPLDKTTEVSFLPMEAIGEEGSLSLEITKPVSEVESGYTYFREGDVTVAKITPCFENGKGAVMKGLHNGVGFGTTELIVTRPIEEKVTSNFLYRLFSSTYFRKNAEGSMYGAGGQKRVPDDFIRDFQTGLPPIHEQIKITEFLDYETEKFESLIKEAALVISLLNERRSALISAAVTGQIDVRNYQPKEIA